MFFNYKNRKYEVDVEKTLEAADKPEDYYPDLEEDGVAIKSFDGKEDFSDCENVVLFYNHVTGDITVQLCRENYTTIKAEVTSEEVQMIHNFFRE